MVRQQCLIWVCHTSFVPGRVEGIQHLAEAAQYLHDEFLMLPEVREVGVRLPEKTEEIGDLGVLCIWDLSIVADSLEVALQGCVDAVNGAHWSSCGEKRLRVGNGVLHSVARDAQSWSSNRRARAAHGNHLREAAFLTPGGIVLEKLPDRLVEEPSGYPFPLPDSVQQIRHACFAGRREAIDLPILPSGLEIPKERDDEEIGSRPVWNARPVGELVRSRRAKGQDGDSVIAKRAERIRKSVEVTANEFGFVAAYVLKVSEDFIYGMPYSGLELGSE